MQLFRAWVSPTSTTKRFFTIGCTTVQRADDRPFPLQVDGDFIGEFNEVEYRVGPRTLNVLS